MKKVIIHQLFLEYRKNLREAKSKEGVSRVIKEVEERYKTLKVKEMFQGKNYIHILDEYGKTLREANRRLKKLGFKAEYDWLDVI